jgi:hypothetical protein
MAAGCRLKSHKAGHLTCGQWGSWLGWFELDPHYCRADTPQLVWLRHLVPLAPCDATRRRRIAMRLLKPEATKWFGTLHQIQHHRHA